MPFTKVQISYMYLLFYLKVFLNVYISVLFLILLYYQFSMWEMQLFGTDWGAGSPISLQPAKSLPLPPPL